MAMIGTNLRQNSELTGAKWQELEEIGYVRHALWCFPRTPPEKSYSVLILFFSYSNVSANYLPFLKFICRIIAKVSFRRNLICSYV